MGPPSYMRSVDDRNVVMRHIPVRMFPNHCTKKNRLFLYTALTGWSLYQRRILTFSKSINKVVCMTPILVQFGPLSMFPCLVCLMFTELLRADYYYYYYYYYYYSQCPTCPCGLRSLPSWAWQKCNRLLSLGRP